MTDNQASVGRDRSGNKALSKRRAAGFTLIEVMIAGTFFLVSFAGVLSGVSYASKEYEHQRNMTAAIAVSETVMEQILLYQQSDARLTAGRTQTFRFDSTGTPDVAGKFTGSWTVSGNTPIAGMKRILLTISWDESRGRRSLSLGAVRQ